MMMMIEVSDCRSIICLYRQIHMQNTGDDSRWAVEGWSLTCIYIYIFIFILSNLIFIVMLLCLVRCKRLIISSHWFCLVVIGFI